MSNGQASILTEAQRQYLRDGNTLSGEPVSNPSEYDNNIRKRLARTLFDLNVLYENLDEEELRKVFARPMASMRGLEDTDGESYGWYCRGCGEYVESANHECEAVNEDPVWNATGPKAFSFLAWALNVDDEPIYPPYDKAQPAFENFTELTEEGIRKYLWDKHNLTANVSVSIELTDVERIEEAYLGEE